MKGLESAINIKYWPGNGEPAKPWGKLKLDPDLWDDNGDTLIFFGRSHHDASFRIRSDLFEETKSKVLMDMLSHGLCKTERDEHGPQSVVYRIYMDPPSSGSKIDILRHHVTTRNFFAFLQRKALVGFTFYQSLVDLHKRLEEFLPPAIDCAAALRSYLVTLGLVNVSNEPRAAAGLLAWSEDVRWNEGWREAFVHSVGMYEQLSKVQEREDISLATKAHLERAHLELQHRVYVAQEQLQRFYFDDVHYSHEDVPPSIQSVSDSFRKFLRQFYEKVYQTWPVKKGQVGLWLDRHLAIRLQEDFNALYEFNVDRNVVWNNDNKSTVRKGGNLLRSVNSLNFGLDAEDHRMLGVFQNVDCRLNASNIPFPYPLLPASLPTPPPPKKSVFSGKKKDKVRESHVAHAYAEASNAFRLSRDYVDNDLAKAFVRFEQADQPGEVDPREARRERWILIYCVLQAVAGISVDVPGLSFKGEVSYFLNARLQDLPPWSPKERTFLDASREQSHCWTNPSTWADHDYEYWNAPKSPLSDRRSESLYDSRPLSPESQKAFSAFFDSKTDTPVSELEESSLFRHGYESPLTEPSTNSMQDNPPAYRVATSKFAAVAGISEHSSKPLPLRPNAPAKPTQKSRQPGR